MLLTLFLTFKFLPKDLVNLALTAYFGLLGVIALTMVLHPFVEPQLPSSIRSIGFHKFFKVPMLKVHSMASRACMHPSLYPPQGAH